MGPAWGVERLVRKAGRTCQKDGCGRTVHARGLCAQHYDSARWRGEIQIRRHSPTTKEKQPCPKDGCGRPAYARGLCRRHYGTEWRRLKRGTAPDWSLKRCIPSDAKCFACGKPAKRRGRYVYLCNMHGQYEYQRIAWWGRPYGTEADTPEGFDPGYAGSEADDEAKIDRLLAERDVRFDDREKPRALDPWFQRNPP